MSTETLTSPHHVLPVGERSSISAEQPTPAVRQPARAACLTRRGAGHLLRSFVSGDDHRSAVDPLMLLGPGGGPIFTSRVL